MTLMTHQTEIGRSADEVVDTFFDWTRDRAWRSGVRHTTVHPSGPALPGQRILEELRLLGTTYVVPVRIDAVHPLRVLWSGASERLTVRGWRDVEPTGPGSCRVTTVVDVTPTRWPGLLTPLAYARAARRDLDRLRVVLEAAPRVALV